MQANIDMCMEYLSKMLATCLADSENKGYPYVMIKYDLINENGIVKPEFDYVPIKKLDDIIRMSSVGILNLNDVKIFDTKTGLVIEPVDFLKTNKGN